MTSFLAEYGLFLLKVLTFVIAILAIIFTVFMLSQKGRRPGTRGQIEINKMNDSLEDMEDALQKIHLDPEQLKLSMKEEKAEKKAKAKEEKKAAKEAKRKRGEGTTQITEPDRKAVFVLDFDGDIRGSAVSALRKEISAILTTAKTDDEIVIGLSLIHI